MEDEGSDDEDEYSASLSNTCISRTYDASKGNTGLGESKDSSGEEDSSNSEG